MIKIVLINSPDSNKNLLEISYLLLLTLSFIWNELSENIKWAKQAVSKF